MNTISTTSILYCLSTIVFGSLAASSRSKRICDGSDYICCIVPDLVDEVSAYYKMSINYTASNVTVDSCKEFTPNQTQIEPEVSYCGDLSCWYLLVLVDPEARKPQLLHWMVVNIPGSDVKKGDPRAQYLSPAPPMGTGIHRYVFLLYKQPGMIDFEEPRIPANSTDNREGFCIREFAKKYCLDNPAVANVFLSQFQE